MIDQRTKKPALVIRPNLVGKADPAVVRAVAGQSDQISNLQARLSAVAQAATLTTPPDMQLVRSSMQAGGPAPMNVTNLIGTLAQPQPPGGMPVAVTTFYSIQPNDVTILADATGGSFTVSLPPASNVPGKIFIIKRLNSGANTVAIASFDKIDGTSPQVLTTQYQQMTVQSDGATYWVVG